jgi:hypothetical protein
MSLPLEGTLALRRRNSWEAVDAGLLLWRANFAYFLPFFAIPFWLCAFALRMLPEHMHPWSWLILWYLKPLFDRAILHVISVRFFEPGSGSGRLFRGLGGNLFRGLVGDLLWRRLSPLRSAVMPLRVLEKLRGRETRKRRQDLVWGGLSFCGFLTIWGFALEIALLGGELIFFGSIMNIIQKDFFTSFRDFFARTELFLFVAWCINYMLVETMYVCMGFGLYINSRVELEGWDIEILLRKFAAERKKKKILPGAPVLLLAAALFLPPAVHAEGPADPGGPPLEVLEQIFASGDFGGEEEGWGIRLKKRGEEPARQEQPSLNISPWVEKIRQSFAFFLRLVLVLGIGVLVFLCFRYLYRNRRVKTALPPEGHMRGLFGAAAEDPAVLLEEARARYGRGELRRAWGLCLAALFEAWSRYRGPAFPPDATEYGCLALIRAAGAPPAETERFALVVRRWAAFAYGGRLPPPGSFEEALALCAALIPRPAANVPGGAGPASGASTAGGADTASTTGRNPQGGRNV